MILTSDQHPQAMLTFEGAQVSGRDAISQKLTSK